MTTLLQWLLGLERIRLSDGGSPVLRFATPPAPWIMLAGAVVAAYAVYTLYHREQAPARWRRVMAVLRFGAIITVLFILAQPLLVLRRNHIDPSRVLILLDRSASMTALDERLPNSNAPISRWIAITDALTRAKDGLIPSLAGRHHVQVLSFAESTSPEADVVASTKLASVSDRLQSRVPNGSQTNLASAIAAALTQSQGSPLAAIIIAGDGRQTNDAPLEAALAQAQARSIPIHVVCAGSAHPLPDLRLDSAACDDDVFLRDRVIVRTRVGINGYDAAFDAEIQLRDKATNEVLATRTIHLDPATPLPPFDLAFQPSKPGRNSFIASITPRPEETNTDNNTVDLSVNARDEKLSVLYVEGPPRYEYRYLKNMLLREPSIDSSCLLVSATPGFAQEGTRPIRRFPQSVEELRPYDVILLGDIDPRGDWISPVQLAMLADHVSQQGAGIAFIAGESFVPHRLRQTPLEKLLPVRIDPEFLGRYEQSIAETYAPKLTIEGRQSGLFGLAADDDSDQWVGSGTGWYWFARVLGPQPASTVLLTHPTTTGAALSMPLAVLGRAGAGRTFYLGTDDLWRWRQSIGEQEYEALWLRIIRTLARNRRLGADCPWRLDVDRRNYEVGQRVHVRLTGAESVLSTDVGDMTLRVMEAQLGLTQRVALRPTHPGSRDFEADFAADAPGHYDLIPQLPEQTDGCKKLGAAIRVTQIDHERLRPEADPELLRMIASRTSGRFAKPGDDLAALAAQIPDRSVQIPDDIEEPLWDKPVMVVLFAVLIIAEWIVRKTRGLP
ncbi:MAG: VWA domain-containing protein [Planctomycetes bacterium]|nr:VWA domain-containing protein [Planctomycetota bacterium]